MAIAPIAEAYDATKAQIVIAWTLQQPGITFSLCGARVESQAIENAKAGRLRLSPGDIEAIDALALINLSDMDR